jgi:hypothetical protein
VVHGADLERLVPGVVGRNTANDLCHWLGVAKRASNTAWYLLHSRLFLVSWVSELAGRPYAPLHAQGLLVHASEEHGLEQQPGQVGTCQLSPAAQILLMVMRRPFK